MLICDCYAIAYRIFFASLFLVFVLYILGRVFLFFWLGANILVQTGFPLSTQRLTWARESGFDALEPQVILVNERQGAVSFHF